tara:strand:+ start:611 stop:1630 length:1020 start_codon:yes stop_codon:yes gene_type:complete
MITSKLNLNQEITIEEINLPEISDSQIMIKVLSCAICGSDLKITKFGNKRITESRTIGHEISGEVFAIGANIKKYKIGDFVSVGADLPCLDCKVCNDGAVNLCKTNYALGYQFDGGLTQYMILNEHVLNGGPIAKYTKISSDIACLAEPLACAINGVDKALRCFTAGVPKNALIFGGGPMGMLIAEYLFSNNINDITIVEMNDPRISFIKENTSFKALKKIDNDMKYDLIFTACPAIETHKLALDLINTSGVVNFFGGLPPEAGTIQLNSNNVHYSESVLMGTHGSTPSQHSKALELLESGNIDLNYLITHKFNLSNIDEALDVARSGLGQKIIINPNE